MRPFLIVAVILLPALLAPTGAALACAVPVRPSCLTGMLPTVQADGFPTPYPGEAPQDYAMRVVVWICTDLSKMPPQAEISARCGPPASPRAHVGPAADLGAKAARTQPPVLP